MKNKVAQTRYLVIVTSNPATRDRVQENASRPEIRPRFRLRNDGDSGVGYVMHSRPACAAFARCFHLVPAAVTILTAMAMVMAVTASTASAATHRIVLAVGHNTGADGRAPLRFAEEDASKFADVMVDLGEVDPADMFLVQGKGSSMVHAALDQAAAAVTRARANPDDRVLLVFFYSGHSDGQTIELGRERLSYAELRGWLRSTGADVRIAIIDSCKSGALLQNKGGAKGPAFNVTLVDELLASGDVFLTSAAADEDALESAEIRGSFFTHHLVSGLRGAADTSGDGAVTLSEAYEYAFNHTVTATAQAGAPPQHPTYDYRVAGRGELRLTELARRSAVLEMPADFQRALVIQPRRDQVIAEITAGTVRRVAVAPGEYSVRLWKEGRQSFGRIKLGAGQVVSLGWEQLTAIEPVPVASRKGGRTEEPVVVEPALPAAQQARWDQQALVVDDRDRLYLGRTQHQIDQRSAFELMGRGDLVAQYDSRRATKQWMIWGGAGLVVGAILIDRLVIEDCGEQIINDPRNPSCISNAGTVNTIATIAVLGGLTTFIVGLVRDDFSLEGRELRTTVDDHNRRLRARLLEGAPGGKPAAAATLGASLELSGWLRRGDHRGGGVALIGRF
jgi:hypothetical protein